MLWRLSPAARRSDSMKGTPRTRLRFSERASYRPLYDNYHDLHIDDGYHIICQEPKEITHESEPGAGGGKSRAGRRGSWPAVPREGIRGHRGRRDHEGGRPDAWRLLSSVRLEG